MPTYDLRLDGGTVVTSAGSGQAHVYVQDGVIAGVSADRAPARDSFDASGLLVMPGMVDAHVHFMDPGDTTREDFISASGAAIRSGVTTVIEHTHAAPVRTPGDLEQKRKYLEGRSHSDFALAAHAWPGEAAAAAETWTAGAAFVKAFTCTTHGVPGHSEAAMKALFEALAAAGGICLLHCEDEALTATREDELRSAGRQDGAVIPEWRSREAEQVAVEVAARLARESGVRAVLAHASHPAVIAAATSLVVESCPQYLTLLESEVEREGPFRKFTPPARARTPAELEEMWAALADRRIDYIASDHAPSTREQKRTGSIWDCHFGLPGVDTTLSILLDGAAQQLVSYERVVEAYSERPAAIYGLPGKGRLAAGADADIVLVDPGERWTVRDADIRSRAGWSPYSGRTLRGRAVRTYLRGRLAAAGDAVAGEPSGRFVSPAR